MPELRKQVNIKLEASKSISILTGTKNQT